MRITFDDGCVLTVPKKHFEKLPLSEGDTVELDEYRERLAPLQFADAYESALTLLDASAKSEQKITQALLRKGYVTSAVEAAVERLKEAHLIDDRVLAERYASAMKNKPIGIYSVKQKLRSKGLSSEDAEHALEAFDEEQQAQAAVKAAEKLYRKYAQLPKREARQKLSASLARRGFSWDSIKEAVDRVVESEDWE